MNAAVARIGLEHCQSRSLSKCGNWLGSMTASVCGHLYKSVAMTASVCEHLYKSVAWSVSRHRSKPWYRVWPRSTYISRSGRK